MKKLLSTLLLYLLVAVSCSDNILSNKYCTLPAHFTFTPVNSIQQLYTSCESMGEWCTIVAQAKQFLFTKANGSQGTANMTAMTGYTGFYMGLSGFIVGLPNIPELGTDQPVVTCYDRACSNCYVEASITKPLQLLEGGQAYCAKCQRTYDLNNIGQVSKGPAGKNLYRYRVFYAQNTLSISNN